MVSQEIRMEYARKVLFHQSYLQPSVSPENLALSSKPSLQHGEGRTRFGCLHPPTRSELVVRDRHPHRRASPSSQGPFALWCNVPFFSIQRRESSWIWIGPLFREAIGDSQQGCKGARIFEEPIRWASEAKARIYDTSSSLGSPNRTLPLTRTSGLTNRTKPSQAPNIRLISIGKTLPQSKQHKKTHE